MKHRHIWLPLLLLVYGITMAVYFGKEHIQSGNTMRLVIFFIIDVALCIGLFIFLKKREKFDRNR